MAFIKMPKILDVTPVPTLEEAARSQAATIDAIIQQRDALKERCDYQHNELVAFSVMEKEMRARIAVLEVERDRYRDLCIKRQCILNSVVHAIGPMINAAHMEIDKEMEIARRMAADAAMDQRLEETDNRTSPSLVQVYTGEGTAEAMAERLAPAKQIQVQRNGGKGARHYAEDMTK
jgi:hypothetical protein